MRGDLRLVRRLRNHVQRNRDHRGEHEQAEFGTALGFGAHHVARNPRGRVRAGTRRIVVVPSSMVEDHHDSRSRPDDTAPEGGRASDATHAAADRGVRVPAFHEPGAVAPGLRGPPPRPGRGRQRPAVGADEVHGHLLGVARRVLSSPRGRTGGSGGGRRAHPIRRRAATGRAVEDDPDPGRGIGASSGRHLLGADRPCAGGRRRALLGLVVARRRRSCAPRRRLPAPDLSRPDAVGGGPRPPVPLHLEPLAQLGGPGAGPFDRRASHRPRQGAAGAAAFRGHARRGAVRSLGAGDRRPSRDAVPRHERG